MELLQSEKSVEQCIDKACQWRKVSEPKELSYYQAYYVQIQNHKYPGCKVIRDEDRYFLHCETLSLTDSKHEERMNQILLSLDSISRDYIYPKSIDLIYLSHCTQDKLQSLLGGICENVVFTKDPNGSYILIGDRGEVAKAKKKLVELEQLICNHFFFSSSISRFLDKEKEKRPNLNVYSVIERMLDYKAQIHSREVIPNIKEKKRITNIRPNTVNKEFVYRSDCPFNPSFHMVIEGKSVQSFIKKYPTSTRMILVNPELWKSLSFVEDDGSTWPGTNRSTQCVANPTITSLFCDVCEGTDFHVMDQNQQLEDVYASIPESNRCTHVLYTEQMFTENQTLNRKEVIRQFEKIFSVVEQLKDHPSLTSDQRNISIVIPTLCTPCNKQLEMEYLTQLFCIYLQKARSIPNSPEVTVYFLVNDNKHLATYKAGYERLVSSASLSSCTQQESIAVIGMKKEMKELTPLLIELLNDVTSFSAMWNACLPSIPTSPFSILSWNILAANYSKPQYWSHVKAPILRCKYRRPLILKYLQKRHPSIFCLQECDDYYHFWKGAFADLGYHSIYMQRPGSKEDGCCIAYDQETLQYESHWGLYYDEISDVAALDKERIGFRENEQNCIFESDPAIQQKAATWVPVDIKRDKNTDSTGELKTRIESCHTMNIALIGMFRDKSTNQKLIVATTHLFWNPNYYQIKLFQSMYLIKAIQLVKEREGEELPVFITMDSNSLPYSSVYNYYCYL